MLCIYSQEVFVWGTSAPEQVDAIQNIQKKLKPLIPPEVLPLTIEASRHRMHTNHLVAGLTRTLAAVRSRRMSTPVAVPKSPLVVPKGSDFPMN